MNGGDAGLDELFDRDADSRLLERRRREELGLAALPPPPSSTPARFGAESMVGDNPPTAPRRAVLRVAVAARPDRALIPGAVVTVVVSLHDDGDVDAHEVVLRVLAPPGAEPVAGSFACDDAPLDGDALLGEGLAIGTVAAGHQLRVRFALRVLPGTEPLDVAVHAGAPGVPTISGPALRLSRRAGHAAIDRPRPFFELESGETDDELRASSMPQTEPAPVTDARVDALIDETAAPNALEIEPELEREPERELTPEPKRRLKPKTTSKSPKRVRKRAAPREHQAAPAAEAESAPEFTLLRSLEPDEVRALERVFAGGVPHGLAGLALLSSIAAVDAPVGDSLGVRDFARSVSAALPRALVAARLQRATPPVVTRQALAAIRPFALAPAGHVGSDGPLLALRLDERGLGALRAVLDRDLEDLFLRGVQVLLAVCPRALENVASETAERAGEALATYRVAAGAWLMRVTVRRSVDRGYDPLTADDPLLHDAGRALVGALRDAVA